MGKAKFDWKVLSQSPVQIPLFFRPMTLFACQQSAMPPTMALVSLASGKRVGQEKNSQSYKCRLLQAVLCHSPSKRLHPRICLCTLRFEPLFNPGPWFLFTNPGSQVRVLSRIEMGQQHLSEDQLQRPLLWNHISWAKSSPWPHTVYLNHKDTHHV